MRENSSDDGLIPEEGLRRFAERMERVSKDVRKVDAKMDSNVVLWLPHGVFFGSSSCAVSMV